jgi:hypothetical protein
MKKYECINCNREFACKRNLDNHNKKKNPCKTNKINNINEVNYDEIKTNNINKDEEIDQEIKENIKEEVKENLKENIKEVIREEELENKLYNDVKTNICKYCETSFTRSDALKRHIEKYCKIKIKQNDEKETIFKQLLLKEEQNKQLQEQIILLLEQQKKKDEQIIDLIKETKPNKYDNINKSKKITNTNNINSNNNTINNTVNIQITQFGKENFNEIDDKDFQKIIRNPRILGVKVPEEILKLLHFNPDYPQFQNFYVSDYNREKIMIHDGKSWILESPDKIKSVLEQIITFGKEKLEEYKDKKLSDDAMNRLKRIEDAINKCDDDFIADLKEMATETANNYDLLKLIKICEEFQKEALGKIKKTSYNEGKKLELTRKI